MSSPEDASPPAASDELKKKKKQRACDFCRRKKSAYFYSISKSAIIPSSDGKYTVRCKLLLHDLPAVSATQGAAM